MEKAIYYAIGSRVLLTDLTHKLALEYNDCVKDLLDLEIVKQLDEYSQHMKVSRLQHSINVSYYSFIISKFLKLDYKSAARAGVLHDLYLYDWRTEKQDGGMHAFVHPKIALENAIIHVEDLNDIEKDAIVNHMFPVTITFPKYRESYIVTLVDKYCATAELISQTIFKIKNFLFKRNLI